MRIPVILALSALPLTLVAQFNTIAPHLSYREASYSKPPMQNDYAPYGNRATDSISVSPHIWCSLPLEGTLHISSKFGQRRNPFRKKESEHHSGLDLSAKAGTPIYAMLPGEVVSVGYDSRSGNFIKLRHGSFTVSYCHLIRKPKIAVGARIMPGQQVAQVGSTGRSTGPHLHITLKRNGRVIDPTILLVYIQKAIVES